MGPPSALGQPNICSTLNLVMPVCGRLTDCNSGDCLETLISSVSAWLSGAKVNVAAIAEAIIKLRVVIISPCGCEIFIV